VRVLWAFFFSFGVYWWVFGRTRAEAGGSGGGTQKKGQGRKEGLDSSKRGGAKLDFFFVVYSVAQCFTACLSRRCVFFLLSFARAFFAQLSYHSIYPRTTDVCFVRLKSHWQQCGFYLLLFFFFCGLFFLFASVVGGPKKKRASTNEAFDSLTFYCVSSSSLSFCWRRFVFRCFSCCSFQFLFLFVYFATKLHCLPLRPQLLSSSFSNALLLCTITESFPRYFPSLPSCMRLWNLQARARLWSRLFFCVLLRCMFFCPVLWVCLVDPEDDIQEVRPETQKKEGGEREKEWKRLQII